jgi:hypothetical protein
MMQAESEKKKNSTRDVSFKLDVEIFPLEKANTMYSKIEQMKKHEVNRIVRVNVSRDYDDSLFERIAKIFKSIFPRKESPNYISLFAREKRV